MRVVRLRRGLVCAVAALAAATAFGSPTDPAAPSCPPHLFVLGRSKNANVVVYDAVREPSGDLAASEPVVAYWLLDGDEAKREDLNLIERERAYGISAEPGNAPGTFAIRFKANGRRRFVLRVLNGCPVVTGSIGGHDGILRRIFVHSKEGALGPKVQSVELFGKDVASGKDLHDKFVPKK